MEHLEPGQKMLAVVKANGYGHGAVEVARVADKVGAAVAFALQFWTKH